MGRAGRGRRSGDRRLLRARRGGGRRLGAWPRGGGDVPSTTSTRRSRSASSEGAIGSTWRQSRWSASTSTFRSRVAPPWRCCATSSPRAAPTPSTASSTRRPTRRSSASLGGPSTTWARTPPAASPRLEELLFTVARRHPQDRFAVAGPMYPAEIDLAGECRARRASAARRAPALLLRHRVHAQPDAPGDAGRRPLPSVRLFEAAACGAAIISDTGPGWRGLHPGQ